MGTSRKIRKIAARRAARDQARERNDRSLRIRRLLNYRKTLLAEMAEPFGGLAHYVAAERLRDVNLALLSERIRSARSEAK